MSSKPLAVEIRDLSKRYLISHQEKHRYLGDALLEKLRKPFAKPTKEEFWALRDVSFNVEQGEVLGIIGRNGAGKSTMLKILSGIAEPTSGEIRMHGKVGALLEVGTGFHPELTGRENVFLNGTILGMRKREVARRFDEIVEFAEVERFIDTPVKRYSSGMYVRLAFAIAANLDPQILIVDEVLAVGDAKFQAKCLGKMHDIASGEGRTVLFVSHNAGAVRQLCTKAVLLKNGQMEYFGDVETALDRYEGLPETPEVAGATVDGAEVVNKGIVLNQVTLNGSEHPELDLEIGENTLDFVVKGYAIYDLNARFGIYLTNEDGVTLAHYGEGIMSEHSPVMEEGPFEWHAQVQLPAGLTGGTYYVTIDISYHHVKPWVVWRKAFKLEKKGFLDGSNRPVLLSGFGVTLLDGSVSRTPGVKTVAKSL